MTASWRVLLLSLAEVVQLAFFCRGLDHPYEGCFYPSCAKRHGAGAECCVAGFPDGRWGSAGCAGLMTQFDGLDIVALFVEQEGGDINRHLGVDGCRVVLHRLFFSDAQDSSVADSVLRM